MGLDLVHEGFDALYQVIATFLGEDVILDTITGVAGVAGDVRGNVLTGLGGRSLSLGVVNDVRLQGPVGLIKGVRGTVAHSAFWISGRITLKTLRVVGAGAQGGADDVREEVLEVAEKMTEFGGGDDETAEFHDALSGLGSEIRGAREVGRDEFLRVDPTLDGASNGTGGPRAMVDGGLKLVALVLLEEDVLAGEHGLAGALDGLPAGGGHVLGGLAQAVRAGDVVDRMGNGRSGGELGLLEVRSDGLDTIATIESLLLALVVKVILVLRWVIHDDDDLQD